MSTNENQYIYRIQLQRPELLTQGATADESSILQDHLTYLQRLAGTGTVLLAGRTQTDDANAYGIVILQAESEDAAMEIMNNDPAVKYRVMNAELFPYKVAVLSESILNAC